MSDLVMAVFAPHRYELKNFYGYDVTRLKNRYRGIFILKNRDGDAEMNLGMGFIGQTGTYFELPKASEMTNKDYDLLIKLR